MSKILKIKLVVSDKKPEATTEVVFSADITKETSKKLYLSYKDRWGEEDMSVISKDSLNLPFINDYHSLGVVSISTYTQEENRKEVEARLRKELIGYLKSKRDAFNNLLIKM